MSTAASILVAARPEPLALDPARSAVLVIDMQNDFGAPGGMFALAGVDIAGIQRVVAPTARVLAAARRAGLAIVYLKMAFRPDLSDAGPPDSASWLRHRRMRVGEPVAAPDGSPSRILIRDTWSSEILPALAPEPGDLVLYKHRFSGFHETGLDGLLRSRGIRTLVFTGCTTSICVESTLRDAMFRDYRWLLLEDCAAEPIGDGLPRSNHDASVLTVEVLLGWVSRSDALIAALQGAGAAT